MIDALLRGRFARFLQRSWRTCALVITAALVAVDISYHVFSGAYGQSAESRSPTPEATPETAPNPVGAVMLTPEQRAAAGIVVEPVTAKPHAEVFRAPGEVRVDEYASSNVSPRLRAMVLTREAKLGDRVRNGQALVRLYSAEMAEAESAFVLATKSYDRMNRLKGYVSGQQFDEAEVKRDETRSQLETFGLGPAEIAALASTGLANRPAGQFELFAPQAGVITADAFRPGEVIEPGKALFEISNLAQVWVEAQVSPETAPRIAGNRARITAGSSTYDGKIFQRLDQLNEQTRTAVIRIEVQNRTESLRPGEYVNVELFGQMMRELLVPTEAVLRTSEGSWIVYVENAHGGFEPQPVQPLHAAEDGTAISGISEGTKVVTKGAFFIKSEAEKSGFGDHD